MNHFAAQRACWLPSACPLGLRNEAMDPFREGKRRGMNRRIVIMGFELRLGETPCRPLNSGTRAQRLLACPGERHETADIARHHRQLDAATRQIALELIDRAADLPWFIERNRG